MQSMIASIPNRAAMAVTEGETILKNANLILIQICRSLLSVSAKEICSLEYK